MGSLVSISGYCPEQGFMEDKQLVIQQEFSFHATNVVQRKDELRYLISTFI